MRQDRWIFTVFALALIGTAFPSAASARDNFLVIVADDLDTVTLG